MQHPPVIKKLFLAVFNKCGRTLWAADFYLPFAFWNTNLLTAARAFVYMIYLSLLPFILLALEKTTDLIGLCEKSLVFCIPLCYIL